MCEQTEVHYLEGDVVWVKLGACWWPGQVRDVDKLPDDILESFRKKPIAAVQFFNEDKYEYVKNLDQICRYNCRRKNEFIKKGLDMYRTRQREGSTFMAKFPDDVSTAEGLTGGDPGIVADNAFAPEEKPNYRNIFGGDKKGEKKGKIGMLSPKASPSLKGQSSSGESPQSSGSRRPITHPRIIRVLKGEEEDHDVRIRQQPVMSQQPASPQNEPYKCYKCDFTSKRLNVIIMHSKSHSSEGTANGEDTKHVRTKSAGSTGTPRGRGRPKKVPPDGSVVSPKSRVKVQNTNSTDAPSRAPSDADTSENTVSENRPNETVPSPEKKSPKSSVFGKRKHSKSAEKITKKKKSSEDFKEKLLADWGDEDPEEEAKEMQILKQQLSKIESLSSPPHETGDELNDSTTKPSASSNPKPKEISCFDFDEKADSLLDHELEERAKKFAEARKFPRIMDEKVEIERRIESTDFSLEESHRPDPKQLLTKAKTKGPSGKGQLAEAEDFSTEFEHIMAETKMPSLPDVPDIKVKTSDDESEELEHDPVNDPDPEDDPEHDSVHIKEEEHDYSRHLSLQQQQGCRQRQQQQQLKQQQVQQQQLKLRALEEEKLLEQQKVLEQEKLLEQQKLHEQEKLLEQQKLLEQEKLLEQQKLLEQEKLLEQQKQLEQEKALEQQKLLEEQKLIEEQQLLEQERLLEQQKLEEQRMQQEQELLQQQEQEQQQLLLLQEQQRQQLEQHAPPEEEQPAAPHLIKEESVPAGEMSLEEMDLDINSMPVVMGDTLLTDETPSKLLSGTITAVNSVTEVLPVSAPASYEKSTPTVMHKMITVPAASISSSTAAILDTEASTSVAKSVSITVPSAASNAPAKVLKQVVKSVKIQPGTSGTAAVTALRTSDGSVITQKGSGQAGRFVVIHHPSGKQTVYSTQTGKPVQQCITLKTVNSQGQGGQTMGKKVLFVKSPQGGPVSQEILTTALQQSLGGSAKIMPQRILTSQGTILKQGGGRNQKVMITSQQMKALAGKQLGGAKLMMQSTPTKVVLPTVQKMVTQQQGVKVVTAGGSAKSKANTILIQTTQGSPIGSTIVSRGLATSSGQAKLTSVPQTVVRQMAPVRPKLLQTGTPGTVQRVVVSSTGRGTVQTVQTVQTGQKVLTTRPTVQPRMLVQKSRNTTPVRVPNIGAIANVPQVQVQQQQTMKKIPNVRAQILQKSKQPHVQKVVSVHQPVVKTESVQASRTITLPTLQPLQPEVTVAPTLHQSFQSNTVVLSSAPAIITQNIAPSQTIAASTPLLSHDQIAQVIAPSGSEQLGDGAPATYVLVAIDDQGTLQPYNTSGLVAYDSSGQTADPNTRTLFIDPSSLGSSDMENIFLAINNSATGDGSTLLNIAPANTVASTNISTAQHSSSVFNITESQPAAPSGSQDILAAALANTDVFQPEGSVADSLTVVNNSQSASGSVMTSRLLESAPLLTQSTGQTTVLLPSLSSMAMPPPNAAGVLETSLTLKPIMTPLEVPSAVSNLQQPPPAIPTSLELPLTITQPGLSIPSTSPYSALPNQTSLQPQETESLESPVASSSVSRAPIRSAASPRPTLQPSMPLLSDDVSDSQTSPVVVEAAGESMENPPSSSFNPVEPQAEAGTSSPEELPGIPSYAQVPEVSSHITDEHDTTRHFTANEQESLSTSVYQEAPESTSEASTVSAAAQENIEASDTQSASEHAVSTSYALKSSQDSLMKDRSEIGSSDPPQNDPSVQRYSSVENTSEAVAVKDLACAPEPAAVEGVPPPYEQVESTSQMQETLGEAPEDVSQEPPSESSPLESYNPAPESTSSMSSEAIEGDSSTSFPHPSYSQAPESTCELQEEEEEEEEKVPGGLASSGSYAQVPESTSHMPEPAAASNSSMDILDSSQHSLDSSVLPPYQVPESSSEASVASYEETNVASDMTTSSSSGRRYASSSQVPESTSQIHDVLTFSDSSTEVSDCAGPIAQSMPILVDSGTGATKRHMEVEEGDCSDDVDLSKKMKVNDTERIKDQVCFSCSLPTNDVGDDDEFRSSILPSPQTDMKTFSRNDIVWVRLPHRFAPGIVTRAFVKERVALVKCICRPQNTKALRKSFSCLIDFRNTERNQQLLEESSNVDPDVKNAYEQVMEYLTQSATGKRISPLQFLTFSKTDKQSPVKQRFNKQVTQTSENACDRKNHSDVQERILSSRNCCDRKIQNNVQEKTQTSKRACNWKNCDEVQKRTKTSQNTCGHKNKDDVEKTNQTSRHAYKSKYYDNVQKEIKTLENASDRKKQIQKRTPTSKNACNPKNYDDFQTRTQRSQSVCSRKNQDDVQTRILWSQSVCSLKNQDDVQTRTLRSQSVCGRKNQDDVRKRTLRSQSVCGRKNQDDVQVRTLRSQSVSGQKNQDDVQKRILRSQSVCGRKNQDDVQKRTLRSQSVFGRKNQDDVQKRTLRSQSVCGRKSQDDVQKRTQRSQSVCSRKKRAGIQKRTDSTPLSRCAALDMRASPPHVNQWSATEAGLVDWEVPEYSNFTDSDSEEETEESKEEKREKMKTEAVRLLLVIKSDSCKKHLREIFEGKFPSRKHEFFMTKNSIQQFNLMRCSGVGPFNESMGVEMLSVLDEYLKTIDVGNSISGFIQRSNYVFSVFMPEALVFALHELRNISWEEAWIEHGKLSRAPWWHLPQ